MIDSSHQVRGHKWTGKEVLIIYDDPLKGQYYISPQTRLPVYSVSKPHLPKGQDWLDTGRWICAFPNDVEQKAIHEAGHAGVCVLEGIKVEYVTIEPHQREGQRLDGLCQWDYGIVAKRKAIENNQLGLCAWAEKEARFFVGGIAAEMRFLREKRLPEEPLNDYAWASDSDSFQKRIEHRAAHLGVDPTVDRDRIVRSMITLMENDDVWKGICRIAAMLVRVGAISGNMTDRLLKEQPSSTENP